MNKKFLSAVLFGALMVSSTGTFVSCKDYDDDIDNLQGQIDGVKSQIAALESKINEGNV
jgi:peptidoglycan hydrolase CwlO-like protein